MCQVRWDMVCLLMLGFGLVLLCPAQGGAQEWRHVFDPYTGQWAALAPPPPAPSPRPTEPAPLAAAGAGGPCAPAPAEGPAAEPAAARKAAALQILRYEPAEASKWVYEQPACPRGHYHKPLQGADVCATPFGSEVAVRCPAGTQLVPDYHGAGSDACRRARTF